MVFQFVRLLTLAKKDKVIYPYMSFTVRVQISVPLDYPFASKNMRNRYEVTIMTLSFISAWFFCP